jgi:hypothetical protein
MCKRALGVWIILVLPPVAFAQPALPPSDSSCTVRSITDPSADSLSAWGDNAARLRILDIVRQLSEESGVKSVAALEIGLAGSQNIYNGIWFVETTAGVVSVTVETPEKTGIPVFAQKPVDHDLYALLWSELEDLRVWTTPSDTKTVNLRADVPVFTATLCGKGRVHRSRIENPPLPTWGKDDTFEQARRRHDKKAREFLLRPRDRAIEVMRLIQAF